jgi:hypothetical protein
MTRTHEQTEKRKLIKATKKKAPRELKRRIAKVKSRSKR